MANLNFTSWLSDQGKVQAVKWAWLTNTADTAKPAAAIGTSAIPGTWVQSATISGHDLTVNTTDAQFDERIYGIQQKVVSKALLRSPAESITFNVDDLSITRLGDLLGESPTNITSPGTGTSMPRYVAEGVRKAHLFVGFSLHDAYEIQWYIANGLTTWRDVKDGNAFVHQVTIDPDLESLNNLNYYRYETVYPEVDV
jgi:hypothetical protein